MNIENGKDIFCKPVSQKTKFFVYVAIFFIVLLGLAIIYFAILDPKGFIEGPLIF